MTTINLYQNQEEAQRKNSSNSSNGGFFFSLSILILTILAIFGMRMYVASIVKQNKILAEKVLQQNQSLAGVNSLQRILDLQTRMNQISENLEIRNGEVQQVWKTKILDHMAGELSSGVVVSSFSLDGDSVKIGFNVKNYNEAARQVLNFKKSSYFSDIELVDMKRDANGISVTMTMNAVKNEIN